MVKTKRKKAPRKMVTTVEIKIQSEKVVKDVIRQLVSEERKHSYACERSRVDELDKAICQIQKDMRSLRVIVNRVDSKTSK